MVSQGSKPPISLGKFIRRARKKAGMTQEEMGYPKLTAKFVSAVERGDFRPSIKALEYLAQRLQLPIETFPVSNSHPKVYDPKLDIATLEEDLNYQYNYAHMLIREGRLEEAYILIADAEEMTAPYTSVLPPSLLYRPHYLRGIYYIQLAEPASAIAHFDTALQVEGIDKQVTAFIRNMLGVAHYLLNNFTEAVQHHLYCRDVSQRDTFKDIGRKISMLRNLANDYWALHYSKQAIDIYKEALALMDDIDSQVQGADIYWAMAMAAEALGAEYAAQAKLYATKALAIYENVGDTQGAATILLHLAEMLIKDGRFSEALEFLQKASDLLADGTDYVLLSNLNYDYAALYLKRGDLPAASRHGMLGLDTIRDVIEQMDLDESARAEWAQNMVKYPPINLYRTYCQALHTQALVEEACSNKKASDELFSESLHQTDRMGLAELANVILISYGAVLVARGDFQGAAELYSKAARA